jgi:2,5-diamino-6-(ribosylamino)-4(3H)-pyrimidinone 5'-phosphate reductase
MAFPPPNSLPWSPSVFTFLTPYLPPLPSPSTAREDGLISKTSTTPEKPFVTLTYASSLDSMLALQPGVQTVLSGPETKALTHFLRSKHDSILVGVGTVLADDPGLNCRLAGAGGYGNELSEPSAPGELKWQPRPLVLDPRGRWAVAAESKILRLAREGRALAPWVLTDLAFVDDERAELLEGCGGKIIPLASEEAGNFEWEDILQVLSSHGLQSVMVEGGAGVINGLLSAEQQALVDAVIVTIAPTWLGQGGVVVAPERRVDGKGSAVNAASLDKVKWQQMGEDVVVCGVLKK